MHDYYNQAARHAEDVSAWTADTVADLPASGNWPGRSIFVISEKSPYFWSGTGWNVGQYDSGWIGAPLTTGWSSYTSGTWGTVSYRKIVNRVYLRGVGLAGSGATSTMFTLPVGFRPPVEIQFQVWVSSNSSSITIDAGGVVKVAGSFAGTTVSLGQPQFTID